MSRMDILRSFARSAARSAGQRLSTTELVRQVKRRLSSVSLLRTTLDDAQLTRAVGRTPGVAAATLRVDHGAIRVQVVDEAGRDMSLQLRPGPVSFAPQGAKEVSFTVEPAELADGPLSADIVGAVAAEIARTLWGPILLGVRRRGTGTNTHSAFVHRAGAVLTADLRTVPEVRAVQGQRLPAAILDILKLEAIEASPGQLLLRPALHGL